MQPSALPEHRRHSSRSSEPRCGKPSTEPNQTGLEGVVALERKETEAQLPPERIDSICSHTSSYYSLSSHSSTVSSSSSWHPRSDSLGTSVSYPDSDDDSATEQRNPFQPIRKTYVYRNLDRGVSIRKDAVPKRAPTPGHPGMTDGHPQQLHHTFPVQGTPVPPSTSTPQLPSMTQAPRCEAMPETAAARPEDARKTVSSAEPISLADECCLLRIPKDGSEVDTQVLDGHTDDSEDCRLTAKPGTSECSGSTSGQQTPARQWPRGKLTEDVCDTLLKDAFDVELQDLPVNMVAETWKSVNTCLEEVSNLLGANKCVGFSLPIREAVGDQSYGSTAGSGFHQYNNIGAGNGLDKGKKRLKPPSRSRCNDGDDKDGSDSEQSLAGVGPGRKKPKVDGPELLFSCPYRKRNPLRFNIRDHIPCAFDGFDDVSHVK